MVQNRRILSRAGLITKVSMLALRFLTPWRLRRFWMFKCHSPWINDKARSRVYARLRPPSQPVGQRACLGRIASEASPASKQVALYVRHLLARLIHEAIPKIRSAESIKR